MFTTPADFKLPSEIIKWRLGTEYSHVAIATYSKFFDAWEVYQASHGFVHSGQLPNFLKINKVVKQYRFSVTSEENKKVISYLKSKTFLGYSEWGALASTVPCLRSVGMGNDGDAEFICSEYVCRAIEQIRGLDYSKHRSSADYVDPKIFERILLENIPDIKIETY